MKRLLTVVVVLGTLVLMAASLVWVTQLVVDWNPKTRRQHATSPPHEMFPILVLTPDNEPHLVYQKDLRQFLQEHPGDVPRSGRSREGAEPEA